MGICNHMRAHKAMIEAKGDESLAEAIAEKFKLSRDYVANQIRMLHAAPR